MDTHILHVFRFKSKFELYTTNTLRLYDSQQGSTVQQQTQLWTALECAQHVRFHNPPL